jgi:hypothetical protein
MLTDTDYQALSRLVDGEIAGSERTRLLERIAREPELSEAYSRLNAMARSMNSAVDAALGDFSQRAHLKLVQAGPPIAPAAPATAPSATESAKAPGRRVVAGRSAAWGMAASIAIVGGLLLSVGSGERTMGTMDSRGALASALESLPSGGDWAELENGARFRGILSFPTEGGHWCREYLLQDAAGAASRGVACRGGSGSWHTEISVAQNSILSEGQYRPAGAGDSDLVGDFIDAHATGIPAGAREEQALLRSGWQRAQER